VKTTTETFEDHLRRQAGRDLDGDLRENYDAACVLIAASGVYRGHDGIRAHCQLLYRRLPSAQWCYRTQYVDGKYAFLEWTAQSPGGSIDDGADSFVIENGKIVAQTVHYTVRYADGRIETA
jgi:hypothetical protein